jgi:probable phosphoglycerate mutase
MTIALRIVRRRREWRVLAIVLASLILALPAAADELSADAPLQIWFVRHAESEINVAATAHSAPDAGVSYPLTKRGMEQAAALAAAHASTPVVAIYTSTLLRAIQTSDALAFKHRIAVTLAPEARELDPGIALDAPDFRPLYQELKNKWLVEGDIEARHGAGESFGDLQRRFLPFVREVMNRHAHDRGVVIIMSHGGTLGMLVPMLANNVPEDFATRHPLTNTGIIKTELKDNSLVCIEWLGITPERFEAAHP